MLLCNNTCIISRAPVAQRAAKQSTRAIGTEPHACNHACNSIFMVNIASGMDPGCVCSTKTMTITELRPLKHVDRTCILSSKKVNRACVTRCRDAEKCQSLKSKSIVSEICLQSLDLFIM